MIQIDEFKESSIKEIANHYGLEKQLDQTVEECAELIQAISKAKRGKLDADNMAEEIADVLIGIEWLKELYDIDALEVQKWIAYKQNRIAKKLENRG